MGTKNRVLTLALPAMLLLGPAALMGQTLPGWGRISFYGMADHTRYGDASARDFSELTTSLTLRSASAENGGLEYALDLRASAYPSSEERSARTSAYDAWVGGRTAGGRFTLRAGQMWLTELGGVGSVGGLMGEFRSLGSGPLGRLRLGLFGGLEPKSSAIGYVSKVKKMGGWAAIDGERNRRHVLGYVVIKDSSLTERAVLTTTNFVPGGKNFFLYQASEYDLSRPGGVGNRGLSYFFANARYSPVRAVEIMANYHRGRSIDTRTITQDVLNGRPVDQKSLDGYRFESVGGRITVEVITNVRIYAGYANDRNNRDDRAAGRVTAGLWASNIAGSGLDLTVSDNRISQSAGGYDARYVSLGRSFGPKLYLSVDYSTSLAVIRFVGAGGVIVESRPQSTRTSLNGVWNISRSYSLIVTAEQLRDGTSTGQRGLLGLSYRF